MLAPQIPGRLIDGIAGPDSGTNMTGFELIWRKQGLRAQCREHDSPIAITSLLTTFKEVTKPS